MTPTRTGSSILTTPADLPQPQMEIMHVLRSMRWIKKKKKNAPEWRSCAFSWARNREKRRGNTAITLLKTEKVNDFLNSSLTYAYKVKSEYNSCYLTQLNKAEIIK